mmetsp:Transcript_57323/g.94785  ORF Transcript_57323/g.94785 Transcript_57323/m.94785 type:complete len:705 (+) Transcript_57323:310-2424(+)
MPEYAELHSSCHQLNGAAQRHIFTHVYVNLDWSLPCSLANGPAPASSPTIPSDGSSPWRLLQGTEGWAGYEMLARHRGKELCVALRPLPPGGQLTGFDGHDGAIPCPTCQACQLSDDDPPCCRHGQPCTRKIVQRAGANHGRAYWACARPRRQQCSSFKWACLRSGECANDWFPSEDTPTTVDTTAQAAGKAETMLLTLRRGMHGRIVVIGVGSDAPEGTHLLFTRADGAAIGFVDMRMRLSSTAIWNVGQWGGFWRRGPDPVWQHAEFRARILSLLQEPMVGVPGVADAQAVLSRPLCETLLDQRLFNGVGNYLRAEICHRAQLPPFLSTREALSISVERERTAHGPVLLEVVQQVLRQAVVDKGRDWLNVYRKSYAKSETDGLGRTMWYRGDRGPLPSTTYEADSGNDCRSLFLARLPERLTRAQLLVLASKFGAVEKLTFNHRRRYAFVRFQNHECAEAALLFMSRSTLLGSRIIAKWKRRLRRRALLDEGGQQGGSECEAREGGGTASGSDGDEEEMAIVVNDNNEESSDAEHIEVEEAAAAVEAAEAKQIPLGKVLLGVTSKAHEPQLSSQPLQAEAGVDEEDDDDEIWEECPATCPAAAIVAPHASTDQHCRSVCAPCTCDAVTQNCKARVLPATEATDAFSRSIRAFQHAGLLTSPAPATASSSLSLLARSINATSVQMLDVQLRNKFADGATTDSV